MLGRLLELLAGCELDLLMQQTLFQPLGMRDTGFVVTPAQLPRFAQVCDGT